MYLLCERGCCFIWSAMNLRWGVGPITYPVFPDVMWETSGVFLVATRFCIILLWKKRNSLFINTFHVDSKVDLACAWRKALMLSDISISSLGVVYFHVDYIISFQWDRQSCDPHLHLNIIYLISFSLSNCFTFLPNWRRLTYDKRFRYKSVKGLSQWQQNAKIVAVS